jgi:hypothetical protein
VIDQCSDTTVRLALSLGLSLVIGATGCAPTINLGTENTGTGGVAANPASGASAGGANPGPVSCSTPAGAPAHFTFLDEVYAAVEGTWQLCAPTFLDAPSDAIGLEFGPNGPAGGLAYYLVQGPSGPVRGQGSDYQRTYNVAQEGSSSFELALHPTPNSGFGGPFAYSPSPRELVITLDLSPFTVRLTAF